MIDAHPTFERMAAFSHAVCVIGGGPVGLITALELADKGVRVLLLESGPDRPHAPAQALSEAENRNPDTHHAPDITTSRRLGGTSNLWGGRCVPYDALDFARRPWLDLPEWPITAADLAPHLRKAVSALGAGKAVFNAPLSGFGADDAFTVDSLERWSTVPRTQVLHRRRLIDHPRLLVALGATATGFAYRHDGLIACVHVHLEGVGQGTVGASHIIVAAGGNESTRLLLAEQRRHPRLFGGIDGPLGRTYMGHVNGQIADVVIENEQLHQGLDFHDDGHGSYVRRRIWPGPETQARERLTNVSFWPVVPRIHDAAHRSGPLSAVFLALATRPVGRRLVAEPIRLKHIGDPVAPVLPHLVNVLSMPLSTLAFAPRFLWRSRVAQPRLPGLFLANPARRYGLEYHAEHLPSPDSRLTLAPTADRTGLPRLIIDFRFGEADAMAVVRAHDALDRWLQRNGLGRLSYRQHTLPAASPGPSCDDRASRVLAEARHGNHQIGTIRMGNDRRHAVVDAACTTFDVGNLHVVSTAVLPTSGQANPTLTAVQLGLRLAERLASGSPLDTGGSARRGIAACSDLATLDG